MAEKDVVVVATVVEGGDVVLTLISEVLFSSLVFIRPSSDLLDTELNAVRAVLPHGNSTGSVMGKKGRSYCCNQQSLL